MIHPPLHLPCLCLPLLIFPSFVVDPYTISLDEPYVQCGGSSFAELYVPVADGTTGCNF
ncbi:hypothetical protein BofuT4_uP031810.1 [Botrytis cinerea T4]|uniref:Uncharacterized protein n=1 Tax=Botryotinia fuckeliana (strain T4) TaxID=999810 RepID=G2Y9M9_BOTF4|nr:hypothetical protein BofuT4_uP031810.1 [Botrytis cinerea T4]